MWLAYAHSSSIEPWVDLAFRFSSDVSLEGVSILVFEVGSALHYFGGVDALLTQAHKDIPIPQWALTPHPEASIWCARAGLNAHIPKSALVNVLSALPIAVMALPPKTHQAIEACGIDTLGGLYALPKAAVARRWGVEVLTRLEAGFLHPRPRQRLPLREHYRRYQDLDDPVYVWAAARPLIETLLRDALEWVRSRGRVIRRLELLLDHGRSQKTTIVVATNSGDQERAWIELIELKLNAAPLKDWVLGVGIGILETEAYRPQSGALLPNTPKSLEEDTFLLEKLQARLGVEAIHGLYCYPDHRPERAYVKEQPGLSHQGDLPRGLRPIWLRDPPVCLGESPYFKRQVLRLVSGPERIESGWWDGGAIGRDYFVAEHPTGSRYWIYRECRGAPLWYLQGIFA